MKLRKLVHIRLKTDDTDDVRLRKMEAEQAAELVASGDASYISRGTWKRYRALKLKSLTRARNNRPTN